MLYLITMKHLCRWLSKKDRYELTIPREICKTIVWTESTILCLQSMEQGEFAIWVARDEYDAIKIASSSPKDCRQDLVKPKQFGARIQVLIPFDFCVAIKWKYPTYLIMEQTAPNLITVKELDINDAARTRLSRNTTTSNIPATTHGKDVNRP